MSHELYPVGNAYSMMRTEDSAMTWHGLEHVIPSDAPFDTWANHPVFDWKIQRSKVRYATSRDPSYPLVSLDDKHVLFRSDNQKALSIVSADYHIVQPRQVLEFFRDLCDRNNLKMDTAGVIRDGVKFWALARTGNEFSVGGKFDIVKQYVLLASSADSSMATTAKPTNVRTVCSNTFHASINNGESAIKVRHSREFDETQVKINLGLMDGEFNAMSEYANEMAKFHVSLTDAYRWIAELITDRTNLTDEEIFDMAAKSRVFKSLWESYTTGPGAEPTVWGLFNAVTHNVDWVKGRGFDTRFDSAQFGAGANLKAKAWERATAVINAARAANDAILAVTA